MALRRVASVLPRRELRGIIGMWMGDGTPAVEQEGQIWRGAIRTSHRGKKSYAKKLIECFKTEIQHEKDNYETDPIVKEGPPNGFTLLEMDGSTIVLHKKHEKEDITVKTSFVEQPLPEKENPEDPESATKRRKSVPLSNRVRPLFDHPPLGKKREKNYVILRDPFKANVKFVLPRSLVIGPEGKHHHTFGWNIEQEPPKDPFYDPPILEVSHTIMLTVQMAKEGLDHQLLLECETDGGYMSINHAGIESKGSPASPIEYTGPSFGELDETLQDTFNSWTEERGIDDVLGDYLVQKIHDIEQQHYQDWLTKVQTFVGQE